MPTPLPEPTAQADLPALNELAARLRLQLSEGRQQLQQDFANGVRAAKIIQQRAAQVDNALQSLWREMGMSRHMALIAVGGYGRGELYPASDVDILILLPESLNEAHLPRIEQFVGLLWDIGLEVGHAVRTVQQCADEADADITVQTTLVESRCLAGSRELYVELNALLHQHLDIQDFFRAKKLEQQERYGRYNETPYSLEPNCKESPGGLRDLQVIQWISRAAGLGTRWKELESHGLITHLEMMQLARVERLLQDLRVRLHFLAKRREDRIVFDYQEQLAENCGIVRSSARRASEILMQRYYRNAKLVVQLNTIVLQNLGRTIFPAQQEHIVTIDDDFQANRELLDMRDEQLFEHKPDAILRSFLVMQQHPELKGMSARTLRALWRARRSIDANYRRNPLHRTLFLQILQQPRGLVHELRRMNQYSILGRYIPAFGRVVGQMQHDLFHIYTVDQHIMQVVRNARRFSMEEHAHEYPFMSRLMAGFDRPWLIYLAALFHDIAKGRGGDHSKLGMRDMRAFCRDHLIGKDDTELLVFLVRHHLTMSQIAQKQDLSDPDVIRAFARLVKTPQRLTALYLLTHADIRGTSHKVWNNWKAKLLEDLFSSAMRMLRGDTAQQSIGIAERQEETRSLLRFHGLRDHVEDPLWKELDTVYFMRHAPEEIAWHTRNLYHCVNSEQPVVKARPNQISEGLQVMVYTRDEPYLFARLCGFFARLGYSIVDSRIHTTRHGYALDSFILLDPSQHLNSREMIALLEHDLTEQLAKHLPLNGPVSGRVSRQVKHFPIQPEVELHRDERGQHWIMQVVAADRPGLLFSVARTLAEHSINLHTAKIATLGERVEDVFLISGDCLNQTQTLLQLERELLDRLNV